MIPELDTRGFIPDRTRAEGLAGGGSTAREAGAAPPGDGSFIVRALDQVRSRALASARPGEALPDFYPDPRVHRTSSGLAVVHLYQVHWGVPVFEAVRTVLFDRDGTLRQLEGGHVPIPEGLGVEPTLPAPTAVLAAARYLAEALGGGVDEPTDGDGNGSPQAGRLELSDTAPRVTAAFPLPSAPCLLRKRPFPGSIPCHLVLFHRGPDLRLGWFVTLDLPHRGGRCDLVVAADGDDSGAILLCRGTAVQAAARGRVFPENPDAGGRRLTDFPPTLGSYPPLRPAAGLPAEFPGDWVNQKRTRGNNTDCRRRNRSVKGKSAQGTVTFDPGDRLGDDQKVLNAFYFCNYLHDLFYLLGFDEAEGNFQEVNATGSGVGGDELQVRVFKAVLGGASMETDVEGDHCRLSLGEGPGDSGRHSALDSHVVFHEFVHGVTARVVGGQGLWKPLLGPPQSRALDEGYCDYFALTIQGFDRLPPDGVAAGVPYPQRIVFGAWTAGNDVTGLRSQPYGRSFPGTFADLGREGFSEHHDAGQVWGEALLRLSHRVGSAVGDPRRGCLIGWQAVFDSLKLLPVAAGTAGFLAARDAIILALEALAAASIALADGRQLLSGSELSAVRDAALTAFADLGMGPGARSDGAFFSGIHADFGGG